MKNTYIWSLFCNPLLNESWPLRTRLHPLWLTSASLLSTSATACSVVCVLDMSDYITLGVAGVRRATLHRRHSLTHSHRSHHSNIYQCGSNVCSRRPMDMNIFTFSWTADATEHSQFWSAFHGARQKVFVCVWCDRESVLSNPYHYHPRLCGMCLMPDHIHVDRFATGSHTVLSYPLFLFFCFGMNSSFDLILFLAKRVGHAYDPSLLL